MKKLKYLELVFENCESVKIPADLIQTFYFNCSEAFISSYNPKQGVSKWLTIDNGTITIKPKGALLDYNWIGQEQNLFGRVSAYNDITQIHLHFNKKIVESYFVRWGEEDPDTDNSRQCSWMKEGELIIHFGDHSDSFEPFYDCEEKI